MRFGRVPDGGGARRRPPPSSRSATPAASTSCATSAATACPCSALDPDPAAIGLRSRYAAGRVCPDPLADEEAFLTSLETLGAQLPQRAVVFPSHDEFIWPLSRHAERLEPLVHRAVLALGRDGQGARQARPDGGGLARRRRHAEDRLRQLRRGARGGGRRDPLPGRAQAGRVAGVQAPLPPPHPRRRDPRRAAAHLRQGRRPRRADAAGAHPRRRGRALDGRLVPGRRVAPAGRVHRPQAAPVPARRRQLPRRREPLGRQARRRRPAAAAGAALPRRQPGRVQARPARRALLPHGGQRAALEVARAGRALRREPLATRPTATPSATRTSPARQQDGVKWIVANKDVPLALLRDRQAPAQRAPRTCARCAARAWTACTRSTTRCPACSTRARSPGRS